MHHLLAHLAECPCREFWLGWANLFFICIFTRQNKTIICNHSFTFQNLLNLAREIFYIWIWHSRISLVRMKWLWPVSMDIWMRKWTHLYTYVNCSFLKLNYNIKSKNMEMWDIIMKLSHRTYEGHLHTLSFFFILIISILLFSLVLWQHWQYACLSYSGNPVHMHHIVSILQHYLHWHFQNFLWHTPCQEVHICWFLLKICHI